MDSKGKMTYYVSESADAAERQLLVTADRALVDRIITEWVEDGAEEAPAKPALK